MITDHHRNIFLLVFFLPLAACTSHGLPSVRWRGQRFQEQHSLQSLPIEVQKALGVGKIGLDGIAEPDGRFNVTDVVESRLPMRRFILGGRSDKALLLVIEHGGYAHYFETSLISLPPGSLQPTEKWTLFEKPSSLKQLIDQLDKRAIAPTILEFRDVANFSVEQTGTPEQIKLTISGLAMHSALAVERMVTEIHGDTMGLKLILVLARKGMSGSFTFQVDIPPTVSKVEFGDRKERIWLRHASKLRREATKGA